MARQRHVEDFLERIVSPCDFCVIPRLRICTVGFNQSANEEFDEK